MVDLSSLNPEQFDAASTTEGPVLVLAGAGSGKTRVITFRIAHLLDLGVPPERILALSFTNKAAGEMQERIASLCGKAARKCWLSTFHALGLRFLREEASQVGLAPGFTILDEGDQIDAVRQALNQMGFDLSRYEPKVVHARVSDFKGKLELPEAGRGGLDAVTAHVMPRYERRLRAMNAVDFDDLVAMPVKALEQNEEIAARWSHRFRYIMVDEYQDTNGAQLRMVKGLVRGYGNLCVVGDDDQSIYAWRGAVAGNILSFGQQFPGARIIKLTQNYRSTNRILQAANHVIKNNSDRHEKTLWSSLGQGAPLRYHLADNDEAEAHWIATDLLSHKRANGLAWRDFAVLYRTNAQSRILEESIRVANIPYRIVGGTRFYDRKEVRDVLAYLRVIANPADEAAYRRIVNYPNRGIGDTSIQRVADHSAVTQQPFWQVVADPSQVVGLTTKVRDALVLLHQRLTTFRERFGTEPMAEVYRDLVKMFSFADDLVRTYDKPQQVRKRLDNIEEIGSALKSYQDRNADASLVNYLAGVCLDTRREEDSDEDEDSVTLMTLHGAKGLEFTAVYFAGIEEGLLPHQRVLDGEGDVAEERRLAYVGITRAKRWLSLSGARERLKFGKIFRRRPSRFLEEIPQELFEGGRTGKIAPLTPEDKERKAKSAFAEMLKLTGGG